MAWFSGKVSLGNFPDLAGAVNKLSESVKNIEKNFDSALGFDEKSDTAGSTSETSGLWPSATDRKALFEPIMGFMGQKGGESTAEQLEEPNSSKPASPVKEEQLANDRSTNNASEQISYGEEGSEEVKKADVDTRSTEETDDGSGGEPEDKVTADPNEAEVVSLLIPAEVSEQIPVQVDQTESANNLQKDERSEEALPKLLQSAEGESTGHMGQVEVIASVPTKDHATESHESMDELKEEDEGEEAEKEKEEKEEEEDEKKRKRRNKRKRRRKRS